MSDIQFLETRAQVESWLKACSTKPFAADEIPLGDIGANGKDTHWTFLTRGLQLIAIISLYFRVIGVNANNLWRQVMFDERARDREGNLLDESSGVLGLPYANDRGAVLLRIKQSPGNIRLAIDEEGALTRIALAIQYSRANHRENPNKQPLCSLIGPQETAVPLYGDGDRTFQKVNDGYLLADTFDQLSARISNDPWWQANEGARGSFAWVPVELLRELAELGWLDGHLREFGFLLPEPKREDPILARLRTAGLSIVSSER